MKPIHVIIGIFVAVLVGGFGYQSFVTMNDQETKEETILRIAKEANEQSGRKQIDSPTQAEAEITASPQASPGVIVKNSNDTSTYTNNDYNFSFAFPSSWQIGNNAIGYGTFQLFNYDYRNVSGGEGFQKGQNKIELVIVSTDDPMTFYSTGVTTETKVAGQKAFMNKGDYYSYVVALPSQSGKYLAVTMYGDMANYPTEDMLISTLTWLK